MDSKFYQQICKNECRNTHHKLVMNSLLHLTCPDADKWQSLFMRHFENYLEGSKAPDKKFKDFRNHVLHVSENFWGGPVKQAEKWYAQTVRDLKKQNWKAAAYSAGVLSHYYMDPIMPLHTAQTEEEGVIHRACEWSINKAFTGLIDQLELTTGYPKVQLPKDGDWLKTAIHQGATIAHRHYQLFIDHYDIEIGARDPAAGLDDELRKITGQLLGIASVGFARVLERAFTESGAIPQESSSFLLQWYFRLTAPVSWVYKSIRNAGGNRGVKKVAAEFEAKGKVVASLSMDEKQVRSQHATEILNIDLAELDEMQIGHVGRKSTAVAPPKKTKKTKNSSPFRLNLDQPLKAAPSIGPKTAKRFKPLGIVTVGEFLDADADAAAAELDVDYLSAEVIRHWQIQTQLACRIPRIYGHDAQILESVGFQAPEEIAMADPEMILSLVDDFADTEEAQSIIRNGKKPDLEEVTNWVEWSKESRALRAA